MRDVFIFPVTVRVSPPLTNAATFIELTVWPKPFTRASTLLQHVLRELAKQLVHLYDHVKFHANMGGHAPFGDKVYTGNI